MSKNFGFFVSDHFHWLVPVLQGWNKALCRYCDQLPEDPPYSYNERANLSLLAGGAWLAKGFIALEEYATAKDKSQANGETYKGRSDLYIANGDFDVSIEAKQAWPIVTETKRSAPNFACQLKAAAEAAGQYRDAENSLGMCFYSLKIPYQKKTLPSAIEGCCDKAVQDLSSLRQKVDMIAWSFPSAASITSKHYDTVGKPYHYPGILMAAIRSDRANKLLCTTS